MSKGFFLFCLQKFPSKILFVPRQKKLRKTASSGAIFYVDEKNINATNISIALNDVVQIITYYAIIIIIIFTT